MFLNFAPRIENSVLLSSHPHAASSDSPPVYRFVFCLEVKIIRFVIITFTPIFFIEISFVLLPLQHPRTPNPSCPSEEHCSDSVKFWSMIRGGRTRSKDWRSAKASMLSALTKSLDLLIKNDMTYPLVSLIVHIHYSSLFLPLTLLTQNHAPLIPSSWSRNMPSLSIKMLWDPSTRPNSKVSIWLPRNLWRTSSVFPF